jgi:hypothetical protein
MHQGQATGERERRGIRGGAEIAWSGVYQRETDRMDQEWVDVCATVRNSAGMFEVMDYA